MAERAYPGHPVWAEIAPELTTRDFERYGAYHMDPDFLRLLSRIRRRSGIPFRVVSAYRPPARNAAAGGATGSAHQDDPCEATDLRVQGSRERYLVLQQALAFRALEALEDIVAAGVLPPDLQHRAQDALRRPGLERVGIYSPTASQANQWGKNSGSLHLDDADGKPRRVAWVNV